MSKGDSGLVIGVEGDRVLEWSEYFFKKMSKPNEFLGGMSSGFKDLVEVRFLRYTACFTASPHRNFGS
jgi:hypothetical protein